MGAELLGTSLLLFVIVGSGIAAQSLGTDLAGQLLAHAVAVGLGLAVLVLLFQTVSGSHFNPAVTAALWWEGTLESHQAIRYFLAQITGGVLGVIVANVTFDLPPFAIATTTRPGWGRLVAESVATFVLVLVILALVRVGEPSAIPAAAGAWVAAIVFATASTGFANPAVTVARALTDTYTGIAPRSVPGFIAAQMLGGLLAVPLARSLYPRPVPQSASA